MNQEKELKEILKGIQEEIEKLTRNKDSIKDYNNRIIELKKEKESIKKDLRKV